MTRLEKAALAVVDRLRKFNHVNKAELEELQSALTEMVEASQYNVYGAPPHPRGHHAEYLDAWAEACG